MKWIVTVDGPKCDDETKVHSVTIGVPERAKCSTPEDARNEALRVARQVLVPDYVTVTEGHHSATTTYYRHTLFGWRVDV